MKTIILLFSAALHVLLLLFVPGYRAPVTAPPPGHSVSYVGALPDMLPSPYAERAESPLRPYSHYHSPEAETAIIEPRAFNYEIQPDAPLPLIDFEKTTRAALGPDIPEDINILADSLAEYVIEPVPFEESILP